MLCACASDATSADLAAIRDVLAKGGDIFVIDIGHLVATEAARLLLELLIEGSGFCALILRFLEVPVISCSHCGAPFKWALIFLPTWYQIRNGWIGFLNFLEWWFFGGGGCPSAACACS